LENLDTADQILLRYLSAESGSSADEWLEKLLSEHAEPIIKRVALFKLRLSANQQDEQDVRSEVVLHLIKRLRDLRKSPASGFIHNFRAYAAQTTHNCCNELLRNKYPIRWRLKNRLRYLFNHRKNLAIWQSPENEWLCGLSEWSKQAAPILVTGTAKNDDCSIASSDRSSASLKMIKLVDAFLAERGSPVSLDELVEAVAEGLGICEPRAVLEQTEDGENIFDFLPDPRVNTASQVEFRIYLEELWKEINQLPLRQRMALLLNLRDAQGRDALQLFPLTGIAGIREIASTQEMPVERLALLWNDLPLDDNHIAELLEIRRQQVINLRKSGRERLARRMAVY
jgi:hypothetical protein